MPAFNISPSRVARHFHFNCDRFLRYAATSGRDRTTEGVPRVDKEGNPVARAVLEGGYDWEDRLLDEHLAAACDVAPGDGPRRDRAWGVDESLERMAGAPAGTWIYQPTLRIGDTFRQRYGLTTELLHFPDCRPDLVEVLQRDGQTVLRIHDAKASSHQKLSHRIQVTLYGLILSAALEDAGVEGVTVDDVGGVWLANRPASDLFDTARVQPGLERFLRERLRPLFEAPADEAAWHLNVRCEWCDWFAHCRQEATETRSVSLLPQLSNHARRYLGSLTPPVHDLDDLEGLLEREDSARVLAGVASLSGAGARLRKQVNALNQGRAFALGSASIALPRMENVRFLITLQTEPVGGQVYVFGWRRIGGGAVFDDDDREHIRVAASDTPADLAEVKRELVRTLHQRLVRVHEHNQDKDFEEQLSLQCYVFDSYEETLLTDCLRESITDPEVGPQALDLFFHFQSPELLTAQQHPQDTAFFPVVVINRVIRELVALPIPVSYRFTDVNRTLRPDEYASDYAASEFFAFELSNQLKSDAVFHAWTKERPDLLEAVQDEIGKRLRGTDSILRGFRERIERHPHARLVAWAPKFRMPARIGIEDPLLSRLAFITRYECLSGYLEMRARRATPLGERMAACHVVPLVADTDRWFIADPPVDAPFDEEFPRYLLSPANDAGEEAQMTFDDFGKRSTVHGARGAVAMAGVEHRSEDGARYRLALRTGRGFPRVRPGDRFLLHERFTDWNTERVLGELHDLDGSREPNLLVRLLADPAAAAASPTPWPVDPGDLDRFADAAGCTRSQQQAMRDVASHRVRLVWGPPGTGKTWFLAQTILALLEAHRLADRPFRVVVTAFTHAAIDNLLRRIRTAQQEHGLCGEAPTLGKTVRSEDPGPGIEPVARKEGGDWLMSHERAVLGATVWSIQDALEADCETGMDLLVVDEASQVKVAEAALALRRLPASGRLVLAGDHRQLPPIISGDYPEPEPGEPLLHRSIFEGVRAAPGGDTCTSTLLENFRMCDALCRYPAQQLYVPEYAPASAEVGDRRLTLDPDTIPDPLVARILDPRNPLVVVIVEGVQTTAESPFEADLAARCVRALRAATTLAEDADGDRRFWEDRLFVITPHHVQRRAVVRAIKATRTWHAEPFVDTVDKMQGQEAESVIVSYGVSDVELALRERTFIYSVNRLNVAITRATSKCVVFLPRPLLDPDLEAFEDDDAAEGIAFMQGLPDAADDVVPVRP